MDDGNIVLLVHCLLIFQGVTGCTSLAVKDNDGDKVHLVKEVDCSPMLTCFSCLVWSCSDVEGEECAQNAERQCRGGVFQGHSLWASN